MPTKFYKLHIKHGKRTRPSVEVDDWAVNDNPITIGKNTVMSSDLAKKIKEAVENVLYKISPSMFH